MLFLEGDVFKRDELFLGLVLSLFGDVFVIEDVSTLLNHSGTDVTRKHYIKEDKSKLQGIKDKFGI